jgi:hypothetical protein
MCSSLPLLLIGPTASLLPRPSSGSPVRASIWARLFRNSGRHDGDLCCSPQVLPTRQARCMLERGILLRMLGARSLAHFVLGDLAVEKVDRSLGWRRAVAQLSRGRGSFRADYACICLSDRPLHLLAGSPSGLKTTPQNSTATRQSTPNDGRETDRAPMRILGRGCWERGSGGRFTGRAGEGRTVGCLGAPRPHLVALERE